ncbi:MAG: type I-B CRISPR-associated protein Cas7/Csh2 [Deltaproteobacteria bacterium]
MSKVIENRSEIIFLYDAKDINPNGDPFENKPRIDDETGINIVTDTRLKRTIRDYLDSFKKADVFISIKRNEDGSLLSREERLKSLDIDKNNKQEIFKKYIDLRLFGATIAVDKTDRKEKGWSITATGPVQFNIGRSLNKVKVETIKGTTVMPSESGKTQGTFTETSIVNYSLICFHGIVNENAAKHTLLTNDDADLLFEAMWNGTKNLITRSKVGQESRMLIQVIYKEKGYHIGDIHRLISAEFSKDEMSIRDIKELKINLSSLINILLTKSDKIDKVRIKLDSQLATVPNFKDSLADKITVEEFNF